MTEEYQWWEWVVGAALWVLLFLVVLGVLWLVVMVGGVR